MTLPSSGNPITLGQIRTELGHSGAIGLNAAEIGTYAAVNTNSTLKPNGSSPSSLSEWYGYDHAASGGPTLFTHNARHSVVSKAAACISGTYTDYYSNCSVLIVGCNVYSDSEGTTAVGTGWLAKSDDSTYELDGLSINFVSTCGA